MSTRIPLHECSGDEILARVTYQVILLDYRTNPDQYDNPTTRLFDLALQWRDSEILPIAEQLDLAAIWVAHGATIASWLTSRIMITSGRAVNLARLGRARRR